MSGENDNSAASRKKITQICTQRAPEGMMYSAEKALTIKQFLDANPDDREDLLPGDNITTL